MTKGWVEGSWNADDPVIPENAGEHVWLWYEVTYNPGDVLPCHRNSIQILLRSTAYHFRERTGRNPRWFWKHLPTTRPPGEVSDRTSEP